MGRPADEDLPGTGGGRGAEPVGAVARWWSGRRPGRRRRRSRWSGAGAAAVGAARGDLAPPAAATARAAGVHGRCGVSGRAVRPRGTSCRRPGQQRPAGWEILGEPGTAGPLPGGRLINFSVEDTTAGRRRPVFCGAPTAAADLPRLDLVVWDGRAGDEDGGSGQPEDQRVRRSEECCRHLGVELEFGAIRRSRGSRRVVAGWVWEGTRSLPLVDVSRLLGWVVVVTDSENGSTTLLFDPERRTRRLTRRGDGCVDDAGIVCPTLIAVAVAAQARRAVTLRRARCVLAKAPLRRRRSRRARRRSVD